MISGEFPVGVFTSLNFCITASLSAICGTCLGETKLTASICSNPSAISRLRYCTFPSVGITAFKPCHASRGHSTIVTSFAIFLEPGAPVDMKSIPEKKNRQHHRNTHQGDVEFRNGSVRRLDHGQNCANQNPHHSHAFRHLKDKPQSRSPHAAAGRDWHETKTRKRGRKTKEKGGEDKPPAASWFVGNPFGLGLQHAGPKW